MYFDIPVKGAFREIVFHLHLKSFHNWMKNALFVMSTYPVSMGLLLELEFYVANTDKQKDRKSEQLHYISTFWDAAYPVKLVDCGSAC